MPLQSQTPITIANQNFGSLSINDHLIIEKGTDNGIKIDRATPAYGWADLKGVMLADSSGANAPVLTEYKTGVFDLGYNATDKQYYRFHAEHSEVTGGDKYLHAHVRHNGTSASGTLVITYVVSHQFGFDRANSPAPITVTQTTPGTSLLSNKTYIEDVLIMKSGGGVGLLDSDLLLPDDDILVTMTVTTLPTVVGGASTRIFIPHVDIHRQVSGMIGTKNKDNLSGSFFL